MTAPRKPNPSGASTAGKADPYLSLRLTARQRCSARALGLSPVLVSLLQRRAANDQPL